MPTDQRPTSRDLLLTREGWVRHDHATDGTSLLALAPRLGAAAVTAILSSSTTPDAAVRALSELGEAAVIADGPDGLRLLTDVNRSFPLFWTARGDHWAVSDDVRVLAGTSGADRASVRQFRAGALVLGEATLYSGVQRTPPDATVHLPPAAEGGARPGEPTIRRRGDLALPEDGPIHDAREAGGAFREALLEAVGTMVARDPDATYLLPLSGGADSRLLASAFVIAGAHDVRCFTYGVAETAEAAVSRRVAELLGLPWTFLATPREQVRTIWQERSTARFLADAYTGAALPHIQDWYALHLLAADPGVPADAVAVPGHTAVRTLKDTQLLEAPDVRREQLVDSIILRHFSQAGPPHDLLADPVVREEVGRTLDRVGYDGSPLGRARALQAVNLDGRQSTYILNSVRGYESFGFGWALPMLDLPLHRVTSSLHWELTRDRDWYRAMTDDVFTEVAGEAAKELSFWAPTAIPEDRRRRIKDVLRGLGLLRFAEHATSSRTNLRHPMAFESFAPDRTEYARRITRGHSPLGVFSAAFLEGRWNRWMDWRSPSTWHTPEVRVVPGPTAG